MSGIEYKSQREEVDLERAFRHAAIQEAACEAAKRRFPFVDFVAWLFGVKISLHYPYMRRFKHKEGIIKQSRVELR